MAGVDCYLRCICLLACLAIVVGNPEQGVWTFHLNQEQQFAAISKHMFKNSKITVTVSLSCGESHDLDAFELSWLLRLSPCAMEYMMITDEINDNANLEGLESFMNNPVTYQKMPYDTIELLRDNQERPCYEEHFKLEGNKTRAPQRWKVPQLPETAVTPGSPPAGGATRRKRQAQAQGQGQGEVKTVQTESQDQKAAQAKDPNPAQGQGQTARPQDQPAKPQGQTAKPQGQPAQPQGQTAKPQGQPVQPQGQPVQPQVQPAQPQGQTAKPLAQTAKPPPQVAQNAPPKVESVPIAGNIAVQAPEGGNEPEVNLEEAEKEREWKSSTMMPDYYSSTGFYDYGDNWEMFGEKIDHQPFAKTWTDGNYLFIIRFKPSTDMPEFKAEVTIRAFYGKENYISALDYPLLVFYGVMGLIYIAFGVAWLALLTCNWQDLLRVQFWVGGVILLGMLEKAVFFGEYENLNKTGQSGSFTLVLAEWVSCSKRTLARMLVIIVSLGFGIVKPRLGQTFHKVLFVGGMFFVFSAIEGYMRATSSKVDQSHQFLYAAVPLAVVDAIICWWIFSSLIQTTRTLRLRRNVVKLTLYRHFTNALIFNVLASVAYMVWFLTQHKFRECVMDWGQLWVDEAFWHVLFVVLLFIIMMLWRPSINNQRYAFSPLLDAADEEDAEEASNDAFDSVKMRGGKNGAPKRDARNNNKDKVEEDLKWVEENIPTSVADKALPSMLDSDEELMTTKYEMSKME